MENLNELFAIPSGATPRVKMGGTTLYGSPELDRKFVQAMRTQSVINPIWKKIEELVNDRTVNPCFLTKSIFGFFINKIFSPYVESGTLGLFSPDTNKIYILVDNWSNMFGTANDDGLARTLLHEMMHLFASSRSQLFSSMFKDEISNFYGVFLSNYFKCKSYSKSEMEELFNFIFKEYELSTGAITLRKYFEKLESLFSRRSKLSSRDFDKALKIYSIMIKFLFTDIKALRTNYTTLFRNIFYCLFDSYKEVFNFKPHGTLLVQELVYPSEIICVVASHASKAGLSKLYSAATKI